MKTAWLLALLASLAFCASASAGPDVALMQKGAERIYALNFTDGGASVEACHRSSDRRLLTCSIEVQGVPMAGPHGATPVVCHVAYYVWRHQEAVPGGTIRCQGVEYVTTEVPGETFTLGETPAPPLPTPPVTTEPGPPGEVVPCKEPKHPGC